MELALQILGFTLGLCYLWFEYRASVWVWVVGVIMPMVHSVLYYRVGLYADCGMEVYYILAGIYGLVRWKAGSGKNEIAISHVSRKNVAVAVAMFLAAAFLLYHILSAYTDSTVPFWDAVTTALAVVGMWMLAEKWVEQWIVWIIADVITVGLYMYKGIPITSILYLAYTVIGIAGYMKWRRMAV